MTKGMLIAGNETALTAAVAGEAAKQNEPYVVALVRNRYSVASPKQAPPDNDENPDKVLEWNPGSPLSARTLVIAAENRLGCIGRAVLVCDPPAAGLALAGLGFADIEVLVNDYIKGWFFLAKEITAVFRARGEGTLALAYPEAGGSSGKEAPDLSSHTALAAFRSLTGNLLASASAEPFMIQGFSGNETGDEAGYAAFIFKQLEEGSRRGNGKLHKFGKLGLFR